jgi:hypothetical protein
MPVRLALAVAPWVAVIAAGLVLAFGPRILAAQQALVAAPAGTTWSAANTRSNPPRRLADRGS